MYAYVDEMYMYNWILLRAPYIYSMARWSFNELLNVKKQHKKKKKKKLQSDLSSADTAGQLDRLEFLFTSCTVKYPCCRIPIWAHGKKAWNASNKQKSWNRFDFIYTCHPGLPRTPGVGHWSKKARRPETCHLVTSLMDFGRDFCWWLNHWNFLGSPTWEGP